MATGGKNDMPVMSWRGKDFEKLSVIELPPRNFKLVRVYKRDMENSGLDPNIFKRAIVNCLVKLQFVLLSFAASGQWVNQNKVYEIGCHFVKLLREVQEALLNIRLLVQNVLERSTRAYHFVDDGNYHMAHKNLDVVEKEMKKLCGQFPEGLLSGMNDLLEEMKTLQYEYVQKREEMQKGFGPEIEKKKNTLKEEKQKKDTEFAKNERNNKAEIEQLRRKWFNKEFHAELANRKEGERQLAELEQRENNDQFQKDIESLDVEPDEMVRRDPKGRALHGAIDAFRSMSSYIGQLQALLSSFQKYYESATIKPVVGLGYSGDLRELVMENSSRIDILTGYCRWMALEDLFQGCINQVHEFHGKFCKELSENPTQAEARQTLKDTDWRAESTQLLRSLEKPDRFVEPEPDKGTTAQDTTRFGETVADDEQTDDRPTVIEAVTPDYPLNSMQVADEHDQDDDDDGVHPISIDNDQDLADLRQRIRRDHRDQGDPGRDDPPPPQRGPRQQDDFPMPPSPVLLSVFILLMLAVVFIQWLLSKIGLL